MTRDRQEFGKAAETAAEQFFRQQKYSILDRNVRFPNGEIDLVVGKEGIIVFVEVKARRNSDFGGAIYAIDRRKEQRLIRLAAQYLAQRGWAQSPCRFDVVLYQGDSPHAQGVQHIKNAFEVTGDDLRW